MKRIILLVTVALMMTVFAGVANAQPPIGGPFAHPHHVHTGNDGCVELDRVLFNPDVRGLHQGSNASGGEDRGPFHGPCGTHPHQGPPPH